MEWHFITLQRFLFWASFCPESAIRFGFSLLLFLVCHWELGPLSSGYLSWHPGFCPVELREAYSVPKDREIPCLECCHGSDQEETMWTVMKRVLVRGTGESTERKRILRQAHICSQCNGKTKPNQTKSRSKSRIVSFPKPTASMINAVCSSVLVHWNMYVLPCWSFGFSLMLRLVIFTIALLLLLCFSRLLGSLLFLINIPVFTTPCRISHKTPAYPGRYLVAAY